MNQAHDFTQALLVEQQDADDFHAACRGAGAAPNKTDGDEQRWQEQGPHGKISGEKPGAGDHGDDLKCAVTQRVPEIRVTSGNQ